MKKNKTPHLSIYLLTVAMALSVSSTHAQDTSVTFNKVKAHFNTFCSFFTNRKEGKPGFEAPASLGVGSIYAANWWIAAEGRNGKPLAACETYHNYGSDFLPGPKATQYNQAYINRWNKLWVITRSEIQHHRNNYQNSGYTLPPAIATWPANGDTAKGEPLTIAPFFDTDGDGKYTPLSGDYPLISGDRAVFLIRNDLGSGKSATYSIPMGVQLKLLFYAFDANDGPLENTIFLSTTLTNIGNDTLNNTKMGLWMDPDIGNMTDDYIGTDSSLHAIYGYNADSFDEDTTARGYGRNVPGVAFTFLNTDLSSSIFYNKRSDSTANQMDPDGFNHFYRYLHNQLTNGEPVPYRYAYGGDPESGVGPSEISEATRPADRRILGIHDPGQLLPGESACVDGAFVWSRAVSGNHLESVTKMKQDVALIRGHYLQQTQLPCESETGIADLKPDSHFKLFPNPAKTEFSIELPAGSSFEELSLWNGLGEPVLKTTLTKVSTESLPAGLYLVHVRTGNGSSTQRLIIQ